MNLFDYDEDAMDFCWDLADMRDEQEEKIEEMKREHEMWFNYGSDDDYEGGYGYSGGGFTLPENLGFYIFLFIIGSLIF